VLLLEGNTSRLEACVPSIQEVKGDETIRDSGG
jgi:hypothetical protein